MNKILGNIILTFVVSIITEILLDNLYRKKKSQLQLPWRKDL